MTELTRRDALASAAFLGALTLAPSVAAATADATGAAWDLSDLYSNDAAWAAERQAVAARLPALAAYKGKLGDAAGFKGALQLQSDLALRVSRLYTYASLKADEDLRVAANQERRQQAQDLYAAYGEAGSWINPELLAVDKAKVERFLAADPALARFRFPVEDVLRQAAHTLSPEEEALLAATSAPLSGPQDIRDQIVASDMPRPTVTLSTGQTARLDDQGYTLHRAAPDRADRKLVFDQFWKSYGAFQNSLGSALVAKVKGDMFQAKARHYGSALEAALAGPNLPEGVYRTLIAETNAGLPVLHRYFDLRRRMLNLPDIAYHDIYPPLVSLDRKFPLAEMRTLTMDAVKPLGPDYVRLFGDVSARKWMDPRPRPGKQSGAYMQPGAYDVHPYLLLNLSDEYEGLSTYAHEWGHAMHSLLANKAQPFELSNYPTFTAEIASTGHELFLARMMLARARTREEKLFYLGQMMETFRGTFFRQAMFAEFQLAIYDLAQKGEGLSGQRMSALNLDLLKRYHGPDFRMDPAYGVEWAYIQHYYFGFYVFQYATSITASNYLVDRVLTGGAKDRDNYLAVLKAGGSDYGYGILKKVGLDMATPTPYRTLVATFSDILDQAEKLIG
ncbi:M3 family oligoendopeptidase [uncultured Sphingomonas sp.]|uniref:M3 family oligoendopeptidase n=1 Tax=uncultured Sphingomonas sp. TaxID=158754 RepID=UPI0025F93B45|nr:M3 family oligoendopeptidase [uncultured Sphingomonas sp.]